MKMIAITALPSETEEVPAVILHKVSISSLIDGASIKKDGRLLASTNYSGIYEEGEILKFNISKDGYVPYEMKIKVTKNTARLYKVKLNKLPEEENPEKELSFKTVPESASIYINGELKGTGSFTGMFKEGSDISVKAVNEGFEEKVLEITVDENTEDIFDIILMKGIKSIVVKTEPKDAVITFQSKKAGVGKASFDFEYGETAALSISRNGFEDRILRLKVDKDTKTSYTVNLKAKPVELVLSPFTKEVIKEITYQNGRFFASDKAGNLYSANLKGKSSWKFASGNTQNANSAPVPAGKYVYFSGAKELLVLESASGN